MYNICYSVDSIGPHPLLQLTVHSAIVAQKWSSFSRFPMLLVVKNNSWSFVSIDA